MNTILLLDKLKRKTVFTIKDIEHIAFCDNAYARQILHRLKEKALIKQISRNLYTLKTNIFVISSNIAYPSYVSFWSASSYSGYTEQVLSRIQIAVTRKVKPINFEGYQIVFIPIKHFFGYKKVQTEEGELFIVENEKLIIDCLLYPKESGNLDEIEKIIANAEISSKKMMAYLKRVNNQTLIKRIGYLLENIRSIDISSSFRLDSNYVQLNPFRKKGKIIIPKWRIKK